MSMTGLFTYHTYGVMLTELVGMTEAPLHSLPFSVYRTTCSDSHLNHIIFKLSLLLWLTKHGSHTFHKSYMNWCTFQRSPPNNSNLNRLPYILQNVYHIPFIVTLFRVRFMDGKTEHYDVQQYFTITILEDYSMKLHCILHKYCKEKKVFLADPVYPTIFSTHLPDYMYRNKIKNIKLQRRLE